MGMDIEVVDAILREHKYRPIVGDVLLIGRQAVYFSPEEIFELMRKHGLEPRLKLEQVVIDNTTLNRDASMAGKTSLISDASLFQLLGSKSIRALDHSDYEGAEVIHDLNKPLPPALKGIADFIIDGSTLDNTFNPALTIQNFAELLRPGGRIVMVNMLSNHNEPYNTQPPMWYLDYFTVNKFIDCKIYVFVGNGKEVNTFCINLDCLLDPSSRVSSFESPHHMGVVAFAEKGPNSTSDVYPSQQHYRSEGDWKTYRSNLATIKANPRPHLVRSRSPIAFDSRGGYLYIDEQFEAVDPTEAAKRRPTVSKLKKSFMKHAWDRVFSSN